MVCIPFNGAIDGKGNVGWATPCLIGIVCHIPKVFSNPQTSRQAATIAPDMLYADGEIAMGCQMFRLCEVGIDIPAGPMGDDYYRVVFSG